MDLENVDVWKAFKNCKRLSMMKMADLGYVHEKYLNVKIDYSNEDELKGLEAMKCNVCQFTAEEMKDDYDKKVKDRNNFVHFRRFVVQKGISTGF